MCWVVSWHSRLVMFTFSRKLAMFFFLLNSYAIFCCQYATVWFRIVYCYVVSNACGKIQNLSWTFVICQCSKGCLNTQYCLYADGLFVTRYTHNEPNLTPEIAIPIPLIYILFYPLSSFESNGSLCCFYGDFYSIRFAIMSNSTSWKPLRIRVVTYARFCL